jgi:hypothetical protein
MRLQGRTPSSPVLALFGSPTFIQSASGANPEKKPMRIRRLALYSLLALAWVGFLVWFAASALQAVM